MDLEKLLNDTADEAARTWIQYLAQQRLDRLNELLAEQNLNLDEALKIIKDTERLIRERIILINRGGPRGMRGFIAEAAQCGIENARQTLFGQKPITEWINDNGPADLKRGVEVIQQKFVNAGDHLSLRAVSQHSQKYPDYLKQAGKYQIPKDHYEKVMKYASMTEDEACKLNEHNSEYSVKQWREVHSFFQHSDIRPEDLEPSDLNYGEAQPDQIHEALKQQEKNLKNANRQRNEKIRQENRPGLGDGLKAAGAGAALEGLSALMMAILKKRREGKAIADFSKSDWEGIFKKSGIGFIKGGIRGSVLFCASNYASGGNTASVITNGMVTAGFSAAEQLYLHRNGQISEEELLNNIETVCLDTAVSVVGMLAGQSLIPIPVLGSLIGNAVGSFLWQNGLDLFNKREQKIIERYLQNIEDFQITLDAEDQQYIARFRQGIDTYLKMMMSAFVPDPQEALKGSIVLLKSLGAEDGEILDSHEKIQMYFLA